MVNYTYVTLTIKEARYLADLIGVQYDLERTIEWCNKFQKLKDDHQSFWMIEPLTTAILTCFARAFSSGVRHKSTIFLLSFLNTDQKEKYEYFINLRSKHIAHSVNEFEENEVKAYYIQESIDKGITSIGEGSSRVIGLSGTEISDISEISLTLLQKIKSEKEAEKKKLLEIASTYTVEDIQNFESKPIKRMSEMNVIKSRDRR